MSNNEVKANQSSLDLYAVTLNWGMAEEGTYSDNVFATSQNEACLKIAEDMANQREYVDELETPKERQEWIVSRACDLGMLRSTCRAAAASCNFPGTYSVIGRKVTEKSCTESFFDRFSVLNANLTHTHELFSNPPQVCQGEQRG
ncbi:hypothetical protein, partial [Pseudomonas putida]|uniref:hypothetical protein n=2 Tax=Pseudomonas putida TaxID=303 RepID=UPI001EE7CBDE